MEGRVHQPVAARGNDQIRVRPDEALHVHVTQHVQHLTTAETCDATPAWRTNGCDESCGGWVSKAVVNWAKASSMGTMTSAAGPDGRLK